MVVAHFALSHHSGKNLRFNKPWPGWIPLSDVHKRGKMVQPCPGGWVFYRTIFYAPNGLEGGELQHAKKQAIREAEKIPL